MSARTRPWYCSDRLTDDWLTIESEGGDLKMLKSLKIVRSIVVNIAIAAISLMAISHGGDVHIFGGVGLAALIAYNGIEVYDYASLLQAIAEAQEQQSQSAGSDPDD